MRTSWSELLAAASTAEASGFDSVWVSDHLQCNSGDEDDDILEAFATAGALAMACPRLTVGTLVASATFRHPAILSKHCATWSQITAGRFVLGLGSGWLEHEHERNGIRFGTQAERSALLERVVTTIRSLSSGTDTTISTRFGDIRNAVHAPPAHSGRLPILIGGEGRTRTLPIAAAHADMWHGRGGLDEITNARAYLRQLAAANGRPADEIECLTTRWVTIRAASAAAAKVLDASLQRHGASRQPPIEVSGPIELVADELVAVVNAGFRHIILSFRSPFDLETIEQLPTLRSVVTAAVDDFGV